MYECWLGVEERTQMVGDRRLSQSELLRKHTGGRAPAVRRADQAQQPKAGRVCQHLQCAREYERVGGLQLTLQYW